MSSDEQDDLPFCPISDPIHVAENHLEKTIWPMNQSNSTPIQSRKVRLEGHFANQRVAKHDRINLLRICAILKARWNLGARARVAMVASYAVSATARASRKRAMAREAGGFFSAARFARHAFHRLASFAIAPRIMSRIR